MGELQLRMLEEEAKRDPEDAERQLARLRGVHAQLADVEVGAVAEALAAEAAQPAGPRSFLPVLTVARHAVIKEAQIRDAPLPTATP